MKQWLSCRSRWLCLMAIAATWSGARVDASRSELILQQAAVADHSPVTGPLVNANFNAKNDGFGHRWDVNNYGAIGSGYNSAFSGGLYLLVNGSQFSGSTRQMRPDGSEYVLGNKMAGLQVTRLIKIDPGRGAARYLEVLHNPTSSVLTRTIAIRTTLGSTAAQILTDSGKNFTSKLGSKDIGLLATSSSSSRPSVLFTVCGHRGIRPTVTVSSRRTITFTYTVSVPANKTVSLLHFAAQRRGVAANQSASLFKMFFDKGQVVDPSIPKELRKGVVNFKISSAAFSALAVMKAMSDLADRLDVERGDSDILYLGEEAQLVGQVECEQLSIETEFGKTTIKAQDIAAISGGAGNGRPMRLYLRNGEILNGKLTVGSLKIKTGGGLVMALQAEQLDTLFMRKSEDDGKPSADLLGYLQTHSGDRLAMSTGGTVYVNAATAWGPLRVPFKKVLALHQVREPVPGYRLFLDDLTQVQVIMHGKPLEIGTLRFGKVTLPTHAVELIQRLLPDEKGEKPTLDVTPHCELLGENFLVGKLADAKVQLLTKAGLTEIETSKITSITRRDDEDSGLPGFVVKLQDGSTLTGRFAAPMIALRSGDNLWKVPAEHIVSVKSPKPKPKAVTPPGKTQDADKTLDPDKNQAKDSDGNQDPAVRKRLQELIDRAKRGASRRASDTPDTDPEPAPVPEPQRPSPPSPIAPPSNGSAPAPFRTPDP